MLRHRALVRSSARRVLVDASRRAETRRNMSTLAATKADGFYYPPVRANERIYRGHARNSPRRDD